MHSPLRTGSDARNGRPPESDEPPPAPRSKGGRFFWISILVHVGLLFLATYLVVSTVTPRPKPVFQAGAQSPGPAAREIEHRIQVTRQKNTMSPPPMLKRVVTTGVSTITLPDIPSLEVEETLTPAPLAGQSTGFAPTSLSAASSSGSAGGMDLNLFGLRKAGDGALEGSLYDLKQTTTGGVSNADYLNVLREFVHGGWNRSRLAGFFRAPIKLFATQFWIPRLPADESPKSFDADKFIKPSQWAIVYKGRVRPPSDGRYRFVGSADDVMVVRFGGKVVLDASLKYARVISGWQPQEFVDQFEPVKYVGAFWVYGDWLDLKASQTYDMEVLLGEFPGGFFQALLTFQKQGARYDSTAEGAPILPIFRLKPSRIPKTEEPAPAYREKNPGPTWRGATTP